ncbi:hypothetical protein ACSAZK_11575 [Methanosarcina sp. Mfa9]|uniref:hypothetical protein n=1 Tax=Methanosarcina sp. Mfa9 TaxID=3439063 RepID=UPI003F839A45
MRKNKNPGKKYRKKIQEKNTGKNLEARKEGIQGKKGFKKKLRASVGKDRKALF